MLLIIPLRRRLKRRRASLLQHAVARLFMSSPLFDFSSYRPLLILASDTLLKKMESFTDTPFPHREEAPRRCHFMAGRATR